MLQREETASFWCVAWLMCVYDMICSCVWHDSFILVTWLMCVYNMISTCVWHDSFIIVTWQVTRKNAPCHTYERLLFTFSEHKFCKDMKGLSHLRHMSHSYAWHAWCTYVTWLIHMCDTCMPGLSHLRLAHLRDMSHSYAWHAWFTCDMTHSYVWHNSFNVSPAFATPNMRDTTLYVCHDLPFQKKALPFLKLTISVYCQHTQYPSTCGSHSVRLICVTWRSTYVTTRHLTKKSIFVNWKHTQNPSKKKKGNDGCVVAASSFFDGVVPPMLPFALDHVIWVECCRVLQGVAACCSVLPSVAECCSVLQSVAECCRVLQCVQPILPFALDHAICDMTRSSVWLDSFMCAWHDSNVCVWYDSFFDVAVCARPCKLRLIYMCVSWLVHVCVMTHSCVLDITHTCAWDATCFCV